MAVMEAIVETVTESLTQLTIMGDVFLILGFMGLLLKSRGFRLGRMEKLYRIVSDNGLWMAWLIALIATSGSLFFSEGAGYEPCKLCWFQRIFMYPLVLILGLASLKNDRKIVPYVLVMSLVGLLVALYHYYVQTAGGEIIPCSITGYAAACSDHFVMRYGYVTIVAMSATAFGLISLVGMVMMSDKKKN